MTLNTYLSAPCRASSIPYWKTKRIAIPDTILILHDADFDTSLLRDYSDEPYFRLKHDLKSIPAFDLPDHYTFSAASLSEYAAHINACYGPGCMSEEKLREYTGHPVYCRELWLAIRDARSGELVASGIGELDAEAGEGILEWIQVSPAHRGKGLGSCIVAELLRRMCGRAIFATVSGQCNNPTSPETMYRKCGFAGDDVWHILRKR